MRKSHWLIGSVVALMACATWSACGSSANGDEGDNRTAFALVNADGTVEQSRGVDASDPLTTGKFPDSKGSYQVLFTRDISRCAAVANVRGSGAPLSTIPAAFAVVGRSSPTQVTVTIWHTGGSNLDEGFELIVIC
jgi:hypothetical protein